MFDFVYVHFNGKRLAVFWTVFFYFKVLGVKNAKIDFLKKENGFESSFFYKIDNKVVTDWSERFEKHQTLEFVLMVDVLRIFKKICIFQNFPDFWNSPVTPGKIVKYT